MNRYKYMTDEKDGILYNRKDGKLFDREGWEIQEIRMHNDGKRSLFIQVWKEGEGSMYWYHN